MKNINNCRLAGIVLLFAFALNAAALEVGDKVPQFSARDQDGNSWKLSDYVGSIMVIYFYPADMTGGCTKQACSYRDHMDKFEKKGVKIIGISGDSVRNHKLFTKVHNLNFTLLADEKGIIAKLFGVPTRKGSSITREIDGTVETLTRGVTASRWTFIIGKDGKVLQKNTKVKAPKDSAAVLGTLD